MNCEKVPLISSVDRGNENDVSSQYGALTQNKSISKCNEIRHRLFPTGFTSEAKEIFSRAWPIYLSNFLIFLAGPISVIFSGHLGRLELAAVAMSTSVVNVSGLTIALGLSSACDTLFSQAYGGENKMILGVYLQRSVIILTLACLPCWAIHLNARVILVTLGQDPEVARLTGEYMLIFMPGLFILSGPSLQLFQCRLYAGVVCLMCRRVSHVTTLSSILIEAGNPHRCSWKVAVSIFGPRPLLPELMIEATIAKASARELSSQPREFSALQTVLSKYLQNQRVLKPLILIGVISNAVNALMQYVLIYVVEMGIHGSAWSQVIGYVTMFSLTVLYTIFWKKSKLTWPGWTWKCLENWGIFFKLAILGLVMVCLEWWTYEIGIFLTGLLGTLELGASTTVYQLVLILYLVSSSIGTAGSIRVGQSLGAGNADAAKTATRVAQTISWCAFVVDGTLIFSLMTVSPYVFTSDVEVAKLATTLMPIFALITFFDSIMALSQGILQGSGRQFIGAIINVSTYGCISLPVIIVLMFVVKLGSAGFWWGVAIGQFPASIIYLIILSRMNWQQEVDKVSKRILTTDMVNKPEVDRAFSSPEDTEPLINGNSNGAIGKMLTFKTSEQHEEDNPMDDNDGRSDSFAYLLFKRLTVVAVLMMIFLAGILTRVFIPVPETPTNNTSITNITDQMSYTEYIPEL